MLIFRWLCVLLCFGSLPVCGQNLMFFGAFPVISQSGSINPKLQYNLYLSSTIDAFNVKVGEKQYPATALQYYVQPSLLYKINKTIQAGLGYAYVNHNLFGIHTDENRFWGQVVVNHKAWKLNVTHRLRYEDRFPLNTQTHQWSQAQLIRYQVGGNLLLYNPAEQKTGFYASASNEFFLYLSGAKNGPVSAKNAVYGEDWVYGGLGYNTNRVGRIEVGYLFQDLIRNPKQEHRFLNLIQLSWSTNFKLDRFAEWFYTPYLMQ